MKLIKVLWYVNTKGIELPGRRQLKGMIKIKEAMYYYINDKELPLMQWAYKKTFGRVCQ
jgi:hypothetical protein